MVGPCCRTAASVRYERSKAAKEGILHAFFSSRSGTWGSPKDELSSSIFNARSLIVRLKFLNLPVSKLAVHLSILRHSAFKNAKAASFSELQIPDTFAEEPVSPLLPLLETPVFKSFQNRQK
jgi:hypothetical protein